jgi:hypothetical protein
MLILPLVFLLFCFLILQKKGFGKRWAFLAATTFSGTSVVLITEILSVPRLVSRAGVAISWSILVALTLLIYLKIERAAVGPPLQQPSETDSDPLDRVTETLLYGAALIVLLVAVTALIAPPSGIDAMTYHMPRVAMWINNHNVRFFPTPNYTQIIYGAFAEYSIMHTILLWGNDRFANMVQFFSFVGSAIAVSFIVKFIGGGRRAQAIAVLLAITIPEGILEASGAMNTYSASFWILTAIAFLLASSEDTSWLNTICLGLSLGLALFTKGTTFIILPFILLACWWLGSRTSRILILKRSAALLLLILVINTPQYLRNYEFDGSPLGVPLNYGEVQLTVTNIGIRSTLANILRNISLQTVTPFESMNLKIERVYRAAIKAVGVDPDDHRQVVWHEPFMVNHLSFQELLAANPFHFALLLMALGIVFARFKQTDDRILLWYSLGITAAFVALSATVKWQRWSSRFQLPLFLLGSVVIALVLTHSARRRMVAAILVILVAWGLLNASINRFRALIPVGRWQSAYEPRAEMYFAYNMDYLADSYIAASEAVDKSSCANVGIDAYTPLSDPEIMRSPDSFLTYPILALIHADGRKRTAWYTSTDNLTQRYVERQPHPPPCAVICLECAKVPAKLEEYRMLPNHTVFGDVVVFTSAANAPR